MHFGKRRTPGWSLWLALGGISLFQQPLLASDPETSKVRVGLVGPQLFFHLPVTVAKEKGFFQEQGIDVEWVEFTGGADAAEALLKNRADVASGAYEQTILFQHQGHDLTAFVSLGKAPGLVFAVSNKTMPDYQNLSDLRGRRIGISGEKSLTHLFADVVLSKGGLKPKDYTLVSVGTGAKASKALREGEIDALVALEPLVTELEQDKAIRVVADGRTLKGSDLIFGGPMPGGALYATNTFLKEHASKIQAMTQAVLKASRLISSSSAKEVLLATPSSLRPRDPTLFELAFQKVQPLFDPSGLFSKSDAEHALSVIQQFRPNIQNKAIRLDQTYTNEFVQAASKS